MDTEPVGVYIHVPFCAAICGYCNFTRGVHDPDLERRYVAAVVREIRRSKGWPPPSHEAARRPREPGATPEALRAAPTADSVYFGGGTPSLLDPADIAAIIGACRETIDVASNVEITIEANPETVTPERLAGYRAAGVNRVSFGVQSFRNDELRRLGRLHDAARAQTAYHDARAAGFDNLSLDLMLALPGQTLDDLMASVGALVALGPEHASLYLFEMHVGTPLGGAIAGGEWPQVSDDDAADMYLETMARLEAAGYEQYEISNVARPGRRARHNVKYWTDGEWLGFGCGAHSTLGHERWNNVASAGEYVERIESGDSPVAARRSLSRREQLEEALFMELRLADGVRVDRIRREYGVDVWQEWGAGLAVFEEAGLLTHDEHRLRLTRRGMILAGSVMTTFLGDGSTVK